MKLTKVTKEDIIGWLKDAEKRLGKYDDPFLDWKFAREIGIYNAILGNKDEAIKGFKKATEYAKDVIKEDNENNKMLITSYRDYMSTALLTQDEKIIKEAAEECSEIENEKTKKRIKYKDNLFIYYYTFTFVNLIKENDNKVEEYLKNLDPYERRGQGYPIADAVRGILKKDTKLLEEGFNKLFKKHIKLVRSETLPTEARLVCIPATCILFLAKMRGMEIKIESEYIPKILFEK